MTDDAPTQRPIRGRQRFFLMVAGGIVAALVLATGAIVWFTHRA